ncbi:MAG: PEP-CTERM sorting domain-containing protein, partial [Caulobacteraceae bacterium]|nr:PEP-CTERM sorting domain-containing protein [Caulobacteraceae bacterium]
MKRLLLTTAALAALGTMANASIIPSLTGVTADGSNFKWTYQGVLAGDQGVQAGNYLYILNFGGYIAGSVHSPYSDVTASVVTSLPSSVIAPPGFTQRPGTVDLLFTYTGPDYHTTGGPYNYFTNFTGLSADSSYSTIDPTGGYTAEAIKNFGQTQGQFAYNQGPVAVPTVPEPATWALMLTGFGLAGGALRA